MAARVKPIAWRAQGVCDAPDASSAFEGAMVSTANLIFNPRSAGQLVPRPASVQLSNFSSFSAPGIPTALLVVGNYAWGFVPSSRYAGKDEPFCYDIVNAAFISLANVTAANCPTTQITSGDWTPPTMAMITNGRIAITHPGYDGASTFIGWIDISSANLTGVTGTVSTTSKTITALSSNPLAAGWQVGQVLSGIGIPAGSHIVSISAPNGGPYAVTIDQMPTIAGSAVALTVTGGSMASPLYGAGNLNGNPLTGVATCVGQYSSRAWYGWKNYVIYSDALMPTQVTAAAQALQIGDNTAITALAGLPLTSQVNGGTLQSLIVFKGAGNMTQITGDAALNTLASNVVNGSVGTLAPNTICATPEGLAYVAPDGVRVFNLSGVCEAPKGTHGQGVAEPFVQALYPTRMCAAFNANVLRVTCQNSQLPGVPYQEWWYHWDLDRWTGPHTSAATIIRPYFGSAVGPFISILAGVAGAMFTSYAEPNNSSTYIENGAQLTWAWQTPLTPDNGAMSMNCLQAISTIACAMPAGQTFQINLLDESGATIDTYTMAAPAISAVLWGGFNWGAMNWGPALKALQQLQIGWSQPEVFKQMQILITGASAAGFALGDLRGNVEALGYVI